MRNTDIKETTDALCFPLKEMGIKIVPYPTYTPDIASWDLCLFLQLMENLEGSHENNEKTKEAVTRILDTFRKWMKSDELTLKEVSVFASLKLRNVS